MTRRCGLFVADRPKSHRTDQLQLPLPSSRGWLDVELGVGVWSYPVPSCLSIPSLLQYRGLGCVPARSQALFLLSFNGNSWANPVGQHRASVLMSPSPGLWVHSLGGMMLKLFCLHRIWSIASWWLVSPT